MWHYVISHFTRFLNELELSDLDRADAIGKADRIARNCFLFGIRTPTSTRDAMPLWVLTEKALPPSRALMWT